MSTGDEILKHVSKKAKKVRKELGPYEYEDDSFDLAYFKMRKIGDNQYYQGEYDSDEDERFGNGAVVAADGAIYEGACGGPGRLIYASGDVYDGEWNEDKAEGEGTFRTIDGQEYVGEWEADRKHGHGVETWQDGSK